MTLSSRFRRFLKAIAGKDTIPDPESPVEVLLSDIATRINTIAENSGGGGEGGSAGSEPYFVDFTKNGTTWSANHTFNDMYAAYNEGKQIWFRFANYTTVMATHEDAHGSDPEMFTAMTTMYSGGKLVQITANAMAGYGTDAIEQEIPVGKPPLIVYTDNITTDPDPYTQHYVYKTSTGGTGVGNRFSQQEALNAISNVPAIYVRPLSYNVSNGYQDYMVRAIYKRYYGRNYSADDYTIALTIDINPSKSKLLYMRYYDPS